MTIKNRPILGGARIPVIVSNDQQDSGEAIPLTITGILTGIADPIAIIAETDDITGALVMIDVVHHEVHEGEMWHGEYTFASVANGNNADIRILTGASGMHFTANVSVTGQASLTLYEAANISVGTAITVYNRNRVVGDVGPIYTMTHTPTVTATGTTALIPGRIIPGGGTPQTRIGANTRSNVEWILLANTNYLLRVNNSSGTAIIVTVEIDGYEA